jgi:GNAT superfamily N-acetyltransferase
LVPDTMIAALSLSGSVERWHEVLPITPPRHCFVALDLAGDVIGFVRRGPSRDERAVRTTGEVQSLYVHPEHWNTGAGRALLDTATQELRSNGFINATLWVLAGNARARRFYERCGWRTDGRTKQDQRQGAVLDEVSYQRRL